MLHVVVLPSVPVTPMITSLRDGNPRNAAANHDRAVELFLTCTYGTCDSSNHSWTSSNGSSPTTPAAPLFREEDIKS